MTLFNPKSLNPTKWFSYILIIVGMHQIGTPRLQGHTFQSAKTKLSEIISGVMTPALTFRSALCLHVGFDQNIETTQNALDEKRGYSFAEISWRNGLWLLPKSSQRGFLSRFFTPYLIFDRLLGSSFFFQALPERTFEKAKVDESGLLKSQQSLLESWLFKCFVLITIVFTGYVLFRIEVNRRSAFAKTNEKIVRELHNDIGSNTAAIGVLADVTESALTNSRDIENARNLVRKIRLLSEKVLENVDEILWSIALKNNSLEEVSKRMRLLGGRLEDNKINFSFDVEGDLLNHKFDVETRNHIYVIFKEILTNITKHADCKNAKAKLSFKEFVELVVMDDGVGFDVQKSHQGNGFHIIRSRCKNLNANLSIISKMGKGTTIKVIFPS